MSAIAGLFFLDGRPASPDTLTPLLSLLEPCGPDGYTVQVEGSAALAHFALHCTPEAVHESWPMRSPAGSVLLADARLDNRADLLRALYPEPGPTPITDGELILSAHARWGREAPRHLIGDFAYALWEPDTQRLQLVRSPFGMKGLYFFQDEVRLAFATTLHALRALAPDAPLDRPWLAAFLTRRSHIAPDVTPIRGLRKVPPAHALQIDLARGEHRLYRFWQLLPDDSRAGWSDARWAATMRATFDEAVAASLRSAGPVALSLSGGMDSSSIALAAHHAMHEDGGAAAVPLHLFSLRMRGWPETEESGYRDEVVAATPAFAARWLEMEVAWTWPLAERWAGLTSMPVPLPNSYSFQPRIEAAHGAGCRVMLSGAGGDLITGSEEYALPPSFWSRGWAERRNEWPYFAGRGWRNGLRFGRALLRGTLPPTWQARWQRWRVGPDLWTERCHRVASAALVPPTPQAGTPLQRYFRESIEDPLAGLAFEWNPELFTLHGMEYRCPFYDRRLVELAYAMPPHLRARGGQSRLLFRRALADLLPPSLLERSDKANFTRFTALALPPAARARAVALPPNSWLGQQGWIDEQCWQQWAHTPGSPMQTIWLHRAHHIDLWARNCLVFPIGIVPANSELAPS